MGDALRAGGAAGRTQVRGGGGFAGVVRSGDVDLIGVRRLGDGTRGGLAGSSAPSVRALAFGGGASTLREVVLSSPAREGPCGGADAVLPVVRSPGTQAGASPVRVGGGGEASPGGVLVAAAVAGEGRLGATAASGTPPREDGAVCGSAPVQRGGEGEGAVGARARAAGPPGGDGADRDWLRADWDADSSLSDGARGK